MAAVSEETPARRHRSWPRRLLIALNIFVLVCVIAAGSAYGYLHWRFGQVHKIHFAKIPSGSKQPLLIDDKTGDPMNVLLVGSDSREQLTGADCKRNCRDENGRLITGRRSDTMMILHVDPGEQRAAILSIPRDLWVSIPGTTRHDRINSAFDGATGPQRLIQTITQNLGLQINHYVEVDFVGFRNLVSAVGGVPIYVPAPARDFYSDLRIPYAGCINFTGDQALAWVRSRHYQYYEAGHWRSDPTSDFGRIARQQDFIRRLMRKSIAQGIRNPFKLNRMIGIAIKNVTIDSQLSTKDIFYLGKKFRSLQPDAVDMVTLPVYLTSVGGASVVKLQQPAAQQLIGRFNGRTAPPAASERPTTGTRELIKVLPNQVRVRTLNGSGVNGLAGKVAAQLQGFGFINAGTGDAPRFNITRTVISYGTGQRDKASLMASYLRGGAQAQEDRSLRGVDLVLTVGRDFSGAAKPATTPTTAGASASPPTTVAPPSPVPVPRGAPAAPQC